LSVSKANTSRPTGILDMSAFQPWRLVSSDTLWWSWIGWASAGFGLSSVQ
jgi:hypothetical protein